MAKERKMNMDEVYFSWWCDQLKEDGLVLSHQKEPHTFLLLNNHPIYYKKHYKTKEPIWKKFDLVKNRVYTPDRVVKFTDKLRNILYGVIEFDLKVLLDYDFNYPGSGNFDNVYQETLFYGTSEQQDKKLGQEMFIIDLWFDVKPPSKALAFSGRFGSSRDFRYNQTLLYEKHKIVVNKVVPIDLFKKTFVPDRYLWTDAGKQPRKINFEYKTFKEWKMEKGLLKI